MTSCCLTQILGLPVMRVAGVEADDVIGTVATRAREVGFVVAIASPDKVRSPQIGLIYHEEHRHVSGGYEPALGGWHSSMAMI